MVVEVPFAYIPGFYESKGATSLQGVDISWLLGEHLLAERETAHAPGTGTPEPGGLTSRELQLLLRGLDGTNLVGGDVVEVAPAYDHAEITSIAAANLGYELLGLLALRKTRG